MCSLGVMGVGERGVWRQEVKKIPSGEHSRGKSLFLGKLAINMVIFHSYFDITRGYRLFLCLFGGPLKPIWSIFWSSLVAGSLSRADRWKAARGTAFLMASPGSSGVLDHG